MEHNERQVEHNDRQVEQRKAPGQGRSRRTLDGGRSAARAELIAQRL